MLVGAEPALAAPAEARGVAEAAFELVEQQVIEDALVIDRRAERGGFGRRAVGHDMPHLRLCPRCAGDGDGRRDEQRDAAPAHDTSTVRNMPISMW